MKIHTGSTNNTDTAIFSDPLRGEVYTGQPRMTVDPPHGPLSRLQGQLQGSDHWSVCRVGNLIADFRFWMDRLIR